MSLTIIVVLVVALLDLSRAERIKKLIHAGPERSQQSFKSSQEHLSHHN